MLRRLLFVALTVISLNVANSSFAANQSQNFEHENEESTLESYNRAMFSFNNGFNHYVLMPVSRGYRAITNQFVRNRINGVIKNLKEPISFTNYLLQGDFKNSGVVLSRFVINSTLGLLGMFDVAKGWGLHNDVTSFDDTFAKWCIPDGPFIVLPFFGPSTPRATAGMALGFAVDPVYWATYNDANVSAKISYSYSALQAVALMEQNMDMLNDLEKNSVDFYATMKSAYLQNRRNKGCFNDVNSSSNVSYDFDFDMEEEEETIHHELLINTKKTKNKKPELLLAQ